MNATTLSSKRFASMVSAILPSGVNALCAMASENISGKTLAPRCSNGILSDQSARLPPAMEGEADISKAWRSLNGCGRTLETQSMEFFKKPGMEPLYSGDEIINALFAKIRLRNSVAPAGIE